jgi:hypothetical protein
MMNNTTNVIIPPSFKSRSIFSKALGKRPLGEVFNSSDDIVFEDILEIMEMSRQVRQMQKPSAKRLKKSTSAPAFLMSESFSRAETEDEILENEKRDEEIVEKSYEDFNFSQPTDLGKIPNLPWFANITAQDLDAIAATNYFPSTIPTSESSSALFSSSSSTETLYAGNSSSTLSTDSLILHEDDNLHRSGRWRIKLSKEEMLDKEEEKEMWGNLFEL